MRIPAKPPDWVESLTVHAETGMYGPLARGRYRHWDTIRRLKPPTGLTPEQWWAAIKLSRLGLLKALPLRDVAGKRFVYATPDPSLELLHRIDQGAAGAIGSSEVGAGPEHGRRYLLSSLAEEAITSSQLEGANTTRKVAKEMIRSGRTPRTHGEQMILNNFEGLGWIRERRDQPLTPDLVLELHSILTKDTLDDNDVGRLQQPGERRVVVSDIEGNELHTPPPAEELPARLADMCRFANGEIGPEGFLHPVIRAVLVHFWLAYDHPFVDGNGRTARALFYWSMLHEGYWLTEYLSISRILRKAPAKYGRSFLYTETDDNDATYFVLYQLEVVGRAIDELHEYLARKNAEVRQVERALKNAGGLNGRQLALLSHALRNPETAYTIEGHRRSHNVVYESARSDLLDLAARGYLMQRKVGRRFVFDAAADLPDRLGA